VAVHELLSDDTELLTWHCCKAYRPPGGAIFAVFGGDRFVDMLLGERSWSRTLDARCDVQLIGVWLSILKVVVTFGRIKGFLYPILSSWSVVFHYIFDPMNQPGWEKYSWITHIPLFIVIFLNLYSRILHRCSHSYASMTLKIIDGIWYDISGNPTWTISSVKDRMTRDLTHTLCMYDLATSFDRGPVSRVATVMLSNDLLAYTSLFSSGSMLWSMFVTAATILPTSQSAFDDHSAGIQPVRRLTDSLY